MARIIKTSKGLALILPEEMIKSLKLNPGDELEIMRIHADVYALFPVKASPLEKASKGAKPGISAEIPSGTPEIGETRETGLAGLTEGELELLKKLNTIRFAHRTGNEIKNRLTKEEMKILQRLVKKGIILHMIKGKYKSKGGVYSISREYYPILREGQKGGEHKGEHLEGKTAELEEIEQTIGKQGFLVTNNERLAEDLAESLKPKLESGELTMIKGFDKAYYIVSSDALNQVGSEILIALKAGEMGLEELASMLKRDKKLVKAVVEILREAGDIIEKRKGIYTLT